MASKDSRDGLSEDSSKAIPMLCLGYQDTTAGLWPRLLPEALAVTRSLDCCMKLWLLPEALTVARSFGCYKKLWLLYETSAVTEALAVA